MKYLLLLIVAICGCDGAKQLLSPTIHDTGPVVIARAAFDYHQTLRFPDGVDVEFNHSGVSTDLFDEGSTVDIKYIGDLHSDGFDNRIVSVKVIKHSPDYIKDHPELWPPREIHWKGDSVVMNDGTICGTVDDNRDIGRGFSAYAMSPPARTSEYESFTTKESARSSLEKACR